MSYFLFDPYSERGFEEPVRLVIKNFDTVEFFKLKILDVRETFRVEYDQFSSHWNYKYKYQIKNEEGKWEDTSYYKWLMPEKISEDGIKYLYYGVPESEYLIVIFQAINTNPTYNYISTLKDLKVNKLFIKDDYGEDDLTHSSYYLGSNKNFNIAEATQKLIKECSENYQINKKNTIFIGSSKGGFSALYHGYKYGPGAIIAGGPQVLLGNYLYPENEDVSPLEAGIFKSIFGELTEENRDWGNNLIVDSMKSASKPYPKTYIHVGFWEPHYRNHVIEFMRIANDLNVDNIELNIKSYHKHNELIHHYPPYVVKTIKEIIAD